MGKLLGGKLFRERGGYESEAGNQRGDLLIRYIFACCGLVVEIQIHSTAKI